MHLLFDKFASPREVRPQEFAGQESWMQEALDKRGTRSRFWRGAINCDSGERQLITIVALLQVPLVFADTSMPCTRLPKASQAFQQPPLPRSEHVFAG